MSDEMDERVSAVLAEYHQRIESESALVASGWAADERRDKLLLPVGPETGRLMNLLVKAARARDIVEVGTSYGYSTVWLAEAARATGGRVITLDLARYKQDYARGMLERAGLAGYVEFRTGDALALLAQIAGPIEFALIDLWKELYIACFELLVPRLAVGAVIVADNMLQPEATRPAAEAYRVRVRRQPGVESVLLPVGSGLYVSRYAPLE
jgi:predicted O-methyltransferase YrrM